MHEYPMKQNRIIYHDPQTIVVGVLNKCIELNDLISG